MAKQRFRTGDDSPSYTLEKVMYLFESVDTYGAFVSMPNEHTLPGYKMSAGGVRPKQSTNLGEWGILDNDAPGPCLRERGRNGTRFEREIRVQGTFEGWHICAATFPKAHQRPYAARYAPLAPRSLSRPRPSPDRG